ncbi:hypothetical protein NH286_03360 [Anaerococcus sp. NML200574]|uniref:hypothetical protein n=1 Tax=Anaerococcus sp. NML200574 TaxID=2954486 RepID=UPI002237AA24|nr:hypothetical protein [Anaerococcus sp. NML200574]MCW6678191.1 hypothetical protein [Anaerococcus sp. NML200574]
MNKMDCKNLNELLKGLLRCSMHGLIDSMWDASEEALIKSFKTLMGTPDDENRPGLFSQMQIAGVIGTVLVSKYGKDEKELMKILKDSDALFVKEIKND